MDALDDNSELVRKAATEMIGEVLQRVGATEGSSDASFRNGLSPLRNVALQDGSSEVRKSARAAICRIGNVAPDLVADDL